VSLSFPFLRSSNIVRCSHPKEARDRNVDAPSSVFRHHTHAQSHAGPKISMERSTAVILPRITSAISHESGETRHLETIVIVFSEYTRIYAMRLKTSIS